MDPPCQIHREFSQQSRSLESRRLEANALTAISKVSSAKGEHAAAISSFAVEIGPGWREAAAAAVG